MPDGGLVTTTADLARLVDALTGGRLVAPDTWAAMTSPRCGRTGARKYGYGVVLGYDGDTPVVLGHSGHDPGVSAIVAHYPGPDTTFVVLCNHDRGSAAVHTRLAAELGLTDPRD